MRNIIAICKREVLSFFVSPVAYFVIVGWILLCGYFFVNILVSFNLYLQRFASMPNAGAPPPGLNLNQVVVEGLFQTILVVLVFLIPLLTMRTIAEEKRRGTFELLVTSPVSIPQIVLGKFLGVATVLLVMMVAMFGFPLILFLIMGDQSPEFYPVVSGLLGVTLCSLGFASVGLAVSAFTENQIVAGVSSMVALLLLYVIHAPADAIGGDAGRVLEYLSPVLQVKDMLRGVISVQALIYFVSLISFGLFVSGRALDAHRWR